MIKGGTTIFIQFIGGGEQNSNNFEKLAYNKKRNKFLNIHFLLISQNLLTKSQY